jgi:hypothetical protein
MSVSTIYDGLPSPTPITETGGLVPDLLAAITVIDKTRTPLLHRLQKNTAKGLNHYWPYLQRSGRGYAANVRVGGATISVNSAQAYTLYYNTCQTISQAFGLSTEMILSDWAGVPNRLEQEKTNSLSIIAMDSEDSFINGVGAAGSANVAAAMNGIQYFCANSGNTGTTPVATLAAATGNTAFETLAQKVWAQGREVDLMLVSPANKPSVNAWTGPGITKFHEMANETLPAYTAVYEADWGVIRIETHQNMPDTYIYVASEKDLHISYFEKPTQEKLGKTFDGEGWDLRCRVTLQFDNPKGCGALTLTT